MSTTPSTARRRMTLTSKVALAAIMLASLTTAATAQTGEPPDPEELDAESVNLRVTVADSGTRSLELQDLARNTLTDLTLTPSVPTSYLALVNDDEYLVGAPFSVFAETGNLYPVTDPVGPAVDTSGEQIDSANISLGLPGQAAVTGLLADLLPNLQLTIDGLLDLANCTATLEALPDVLALIPDPGLPVATVIALPDIEAEVAAVCAAISGLADTLPDPATVGDDLPLPVELPLPEIPDLDLADITELVDLLGLVDVPLAPGPFTDPSFRGLGSTDADAAGAAPPTQALLMQSIPSGIDLTALLAALPALPDLPADVSGVTGGTGAVIQALVNETTTNALGMALQDVSDPAALTAIVNTLLNVVNGVIDLSDFTDLIGTYIAAPALTFTLPTGNDAPTPGDWAGSHTVTLVSP